MRSARIAPDWIAMATNFLRQLSIADWLIALVLFVGLFFVFVFLINRRPWNAGRPLRLRGFFVSFHRFSFVFFVFFAFGDKNGDLIGGRE